MEWFQKSFILQATAHNLYGKPILLIYDGHGSHETHPMHQLAVNNNIILLSLSPHTTHKLQPLDVRVFGPFWHAWVDQYDEVLEDIGTEIPQQDFVKEYMDVQNTTFSTNSIAKVFKSCSIYPFNSDVFSHHNFAPSIPSLVQGFVPSMFPVQAVPTLPSDHTNDMDNIEDSDYTTGDSSDTDDSNSSSDSDKEEGGYHRCDQQEKQRWLQI